MEPRGDWLQRLGAIKQWTRVGERAPHKPLLLLYAFGRLQRSGTSGMSFAEAEPVLDRLLREYGPPRKSSPAYPFHHLQSDGLWTVAAAGDPGASRTRLRQTGARGSLTPEFERALQEDPGLLALATRAILDANFPESVQADLCRDVGLDLEALEAGAVKRRAEALRRRDPQFRDRVLVAYEFRCAMCGYDGRIATEAVGLDAAHLRWWAFDGPDTVANGLCLCSFHHKLLDRGVVGVGPEHTVTVSGQFVGRGRVAEELVLRLVGEPLFAPQPGQPLPDPAHVDWHARQVFRSPARERP